MVRATVLFSVKNSGCQLKEKIQCLEDQTFKKFELLVIDGSSIDNGIVFFEHSNLQHIRIIPEPQLGLDKALTLGVNEAKIYIIIRQDHDDVYVPSRFRHQYIFLEKDKDFVAFGSNATKIEEIRKKKGVKKISWRFEGNRNVFYFV
jgi:glycosyltransferase involved in cell wall biosynthesis